VIGGDAGAEGGEVGHGGLPRVLRQDIGENGVDGCLFSGQSVGNWLYVGGSGGWITCG
jgi:hypothetical protein